MCKASITARHTYMAERGVVYRISMNWDGLAALHKHDEHPSDSVACIRGEQQITLCKIPLRVQLEHLIRATDVATFLPDKDDHDDLLQLSTGKIVPFATFANIGVSVFVGITELPKEVEITAAPVIARVLEFA